MVAAIELLLEANDKAGTIRPGVSTDDFVLAIAGIWQIDPEGDWQPRAARLLDLVMDGLRAGAPGGGETGLAPVAQPYLPAQGTSGGPTMSMPCAAAISVSRDGSGMSSPSPAAAAANCSNVGP